ncbi:MAG: DUF4097 domain-containing protein [Firmicutes bacterium]|nr:DUF4097 domain-containing protein [Bacillota bacterium]
MALFSKVSSQEEFSLGPKIESISIQGFNGAIAWLPLDGGAPRIVAEKEVRGLSLGGLDQILADLQIECDISEGKIALRSINSPKALGINAKVDFSVYVSPEQIKHFQAITSNGAVSVEVPTCGKLDLTTSNGRIMLQSGQGEINAKTSNGRIEFGLLALEGYSSLRTSNGRIAGQAKFATDGRYTIDTSNGSIELRIPHDSSGSFQARTSNGHVKFEVGDTQLNGRKQVVLEKGDNPSISLATSNGNITVLGY